MKSIFRLLLVLCAGTSVLAIPQTQITYSVKDHGGGRWAYTYTVENLSLTETIEEFTVWFADDLYENILDESPIAITQHWDEETFEPQPLLFQDGGYDALTTTAAISAGHLVDGFVVSFDWLGIGTPGSQAYDIINPDTFETIDSGHTIIPEPASLALLLAGSLAFCRKRY